MFALRESGLLICGGANTAVNSPGNVKAWLVEYGRGKLPSASLSFAAIILRLSHMASLTDHIAMSLRRMGHRAICGGIAVCCRV